MKTEILKVKGDWQEVVDDCRSTVGKESLGHEPSSKFKKMILIAEHSPIRDISIRWSWKSIKYWIAMHWKTHHWESKVRTQRTDRTGVSRDDLPQAALVDFTGEANCQHLIDTMRKRLCYQASTETRKYAEDLKKAIKDFQPELSDVLVPNCVYRGGCPEMNCCGYYEKLWMKNGFIRGDDIQKRYDAYNEIFWKEKGGAE